MTVRLLKPWKGYMAGVVLRVDDGKAATMIRLGYAVPLTREDLRPRREKPHKKLDPTVYRDPHRSLRTKNTPD